MSGRLFDVYLTGATDKNPSAQMRLAAGIAARYRLSAPVVAEALEGAACRVGAGLGARDAQAMVEALTTMGASARVSPAGAPFVPGNIVPAAPVTVAARSPPPSSASSPAPARAPAPPRVGVVPAPRASDEFLAVPARKDGRITLKSAEVETPLVDISEPIDFAEPGPDGKTGVRSPDNIRCPKHGLTYNRRKASGCVRCLAAARAQAQKLREQSHGHMVDTPVAGSSLRHNPVRRAFWGLGLALLVGFFPAAYYARRINRVALLVLRARQAEIAALPVTADSLARFDALDGDVDAVHARGAGRTLVIWIVSTALVGGGWIRLTRPGDSRDDHPSST